MGHRRWEDLDSRTRRVIVLGSTFEGALKVAALIDLALRTSQVRGSKARWAVAITLVNSIGALPIAYFVYGRRRPSGR